MESSIRSWRYEIIFIKNDLVPPTTILLSFLKTILKTSSDIYFFENFRKSDRAPEVPIFECKLCTKAQHHGILQEAPIRFILLAKPSLSFFYM